MQGRRSKERCDVEEERNNKEGKKEGEVRTW
jgi:hypothetical protein